MDWTIPPSLSPTEMRHRSLERTAQMQRLAKDPIALFNPLPKQKEFLESKASTRLFRAGNQVGKTATCAIDFAKAALGRHPLFPSNRPLLLYVIGYDLDHIGRRVYSALFKPGLFQIIKDEHTGRWRTYRPWSKADEARQEEAEDAPPLIPPEVIDPKGWAWDHKADRQFSVCRLFFGEGHPMNGTEIRAYGSKSEPPQGDQVDLIWFDEDLADPKWVSEMYMRLMKRKGRLTWSAMPHLRNDALVNLSRLAEEQKHDEKPNVQEFVMSLLDNPYIDPEEIKKATEGLSHDEYRARVHGDFCADSILVYPNFNRDLHCYPRPPKEPKDVLDKLLDELKGQIPYEWTRYLSVDPGHTVCAVISGAIPPPELVGGQDFIVIEDELYLRRCDAETFGDEVKKLVTGRFYEAFVIDDHGSRVTQAGPGLTIKRQYSDALESRGVRSRQTDSTFYRGTDNIEGGCELVRGWMGIRINGTCKIRIMKERCPHLIQEFPYYKKKIVLKDEVQDRPLNRKCHALDALRYLAGIKPIYIKPDPPKKPDSPGYLAWKRFTTEMNQGQYINLGPAA